VIEHGAAGGPLPTTQGVGRLMKLLHELKAQSACGPATASTPLAECKFNIHHSIGEPQTATAQKILSLVQKHCSSASAVANTVSDQASMDERALVRRAGGAINPMVAQALVQMHSPTAIAAMGAQQLRGSLLQAGAEASLAAVEQLQGQLLGAAAREKPAPEFLGRKQWG
jgi:hypothetical protein